MAVNLAVDTYSRTHLQLGSALRVIPHRAESHEGGLQSLQSVCSDVLSCCRQCVTMRELLKSFLAAPWAQLGSEFASHSHLIDACMPDC